MSSPPASPLVQLDRSNNIRASCAADFRSSSKSTKYVPSPGDTDLKDKGEAYVSERLTTPTF